MLDPTRLSLAALALVMALHQAPSAWATGELDDLRQGAIAVEEVPVSEGGAVRAQLFVAAPPEVARDVLWAHERYPEFMPHSRTVKVLERRGNVHLVEMAGGKGPVNVSYRMERRLEPRRITWKTISGDVKRNEGHWAFDASEGGTLLTYQVHVVPNAPVPGKVVAFLQQQALPGMLEAVRKRIEQEAARKGS